MNNQFKLVIIFTLIFNSSCEKRVTKEKTSLSTFQDKQSDEDYYFSCLAVNEEFSKEKTPSLCLRDDNGVKSVPSDLFFSYLDSKQSNSLNLTPLKIDLGTKVKGGFDGLYGKQGKNKQGVKRPSSNIENQGFQGKGPFPSKQPEKINSKVSKKVENLLEAHYKRFENPNIKRELHALNALSNKSPISAVPVETKALVMSKSFETHVKFLEDSIRLHRKKIPVDSDFIKGLEGKLTNLGKARKEIEYSLENQVQLLKMWQNEKSITSLSGNLSKKINRLFIKAIAKKDSYSFLKAYNDLKTKGHYTNLPDFQKRKFVAIARPVEDVGYQKMALGYDGKPVNMKGKSSKKTGFIPLDQRLSKLPGRYYEKLKGLTEPDLTTEVKKAKKELAKYQQKSSLGSKTIEPNFLPTSISKPYFKKTTTISGSKEIVSYQIGIISKQNLEKLDGDAYRKGLKDLENGDIEMREVSGFFDGVDVDKLKDKGQSYIAELIAKKQFDQTKFDIVRHHANPATVSLRGVSDQQMAEWGNAFKASKQKEFNEYCRKIPREPSTLGREEAEILRSNWNKKLDTPLEKQFANFVFEKKLGRKASASEVEAFYMNSKEISADVDTWGKGQKGAVTIDNFSYQLKGKTSKDIAAKNRADKYDVFVDYPPGLLESGSLTRLSKHYYEHLNTGFPQRLVDDYPLSIQVIEGGQVKIVEITKGPEGNPHKDFVERLEALAQEEIFLPLNPRDVLKNFSDYKVALKDAPNMARFILKYFDDSISTSGTKKSALDSLKIDGDRAKAIINTCTEAIENKKGSYKIKEDVKKYDEMIDKLEILTISYFHNKGSSTYGFLPHQTTLLAA